MNVNSTLFLNKMTILSYGLLCGKTDMQLIINN